MLDRRMTQNQPTISNTVLEKLAEDEVPKDLFLGNVVGAFSRALSDKMDRAVTDAIGMSTSAAYAIVQIGTEPNSTIDELRKMLSLEHSRPRWGCFSS